MLKKMFLIISLMAIISYSYGGSIYGKVTLPDKIERPPRPLKVHSYSGSEKPMNMKHVQLNEMDNVVVYIEKVNSEKRFTTSTEKVSMDQKDETFIPHVLPVLVGTSVDFINKDDFYHSVFSYSRAKTFDLGKYPKGIKRAVLFDKMGIVEIFCEIHSYMQAFVLVLQNPYFAKPDSTGNYHIEDIPPGNYDLVAWHDVLKPIRQPVEIKENNKLQVDFEFKKK
jgi:plastocyanin